MNTKPNILFVFSDQHSAHTMSCAGDPNIETPNFDQLAHEGIRFANAYANTPLCSPFRACLYTGQYITTHGVTSLHRPLLPRQPELAEVLLRHGYHTSHLGKWHLSGGAAPSHFVSPYFRPGWRQWRGWENSNEPFATTYSEGDLPQPLCTMQGYQTDVLTDWTLKFLAENREAGPWFHVVSIEPPHPPNQAPEAFARLFAERKLALRPNVPREHPRFSAFVDHLRHYYAQIANLDWNLGRILDQLEATGQRERTMVWYFSDHGDCMGSHGRMQKSRPEEESSKIPLIIRWPETIPAGTASQALISSVDIMPLCWDRWGCRFPTPWTAKTLAAACVNPAPSAPRASSCSTSPPSSRQPRSRYTAACGMGRGNWCIGCRRNRINCITWMTIRSS
jgi:arylsulfatase A-like enzyme